MDWFYRLDGQETGPVTAKDLKALFKDKTIAADTPVRREDMSEWKPLRHFVKSPSPKAPAAESPAPMSPKSESPEPQPLQTVSHDLGQVSEKVPAAPVALPKPRCSECGRAFPPDDLIRFDDALICAACKPVFTQKLREGVRVQGTLNYAGFWIRFGAKFIDTLIVTILGMIVGFGIGLVLGGGFDESGGSLAVNFFIQAVNLIIPAVYGTYFIGHYGATLGKMACGIKVVRPDGGAISYPRALGRHFAEYLSGLILAIGYIMAAFDSEKRSLHDRICSTRVVRK